MSRPLLPPRYVHAPSSLIYSDLPTSIIVTGVRIWGLGWKHKYRRTGSIPLQHVCDICELSRTQLYEHLARLVGTGVLRYTNIDGQFTFHFDWEDRRGPTVCHTSSTGPIRVRPSPENRTGGAVSVVAVSSSREELSPHEKQQHSTHTHAVGGECERGSGPSGKPDWAASEILDAGASKILEALGIGEPTRSQLLRLAHVTERYLAGWLAWYRSQDRLGRGGQR